MKQRQGDDVRTTVIIPKELLVAAQEKAAEDDLSISQVVRRALREYVEGKERR